MDKGYIAIDGSHLFASVVEIWKNKDGFDKRKLNIGLLTRYLMDRWGENMGSTVRVNYYFVEGDERIDEMLEIPKIEEPGQKDHWQIIQCGEKIKSIPEDELQRLSPKYRDHFARAEKGLDTKLTCDALTLVAMGKADNIVLLVNDRDYVPLIKAIQRLGANVYLTALDSKQRKQTKLIDLCDKYLTCDPYLKTLFDVKDEPILVAKPA